MEIFLQIVLGVFIGFWAFMFAFPLIPGAVNMLANEPNRYRRPGETKLSYSRSQYALFTFLQPGQVKIIEVGEKFSRALMAYDGHMFEGERLDNNYTPAHYQFWRVVETALGYTDSHPLPFPEIGFFWVFYSPLSILFWIWKRWVYNLTGAVFVGIPPFRKVRTYPLERFKWISLKNGGIDLERIHDYSDHYRVADFQYASLVPRADTQDKIPVSISLNIIAQAVNPYMLAYNSDDDWLTRFGACIDDAVTTTTRSRPLEDVLSAKSGDAAQMLNADIKSRIQKAVDRIGIEVHLTQIRDISPVNEQDRLSLGELARSRITRASKEELAIGQAAYIREEGKAMREHPNSEVVVQTEGMVRAAEAAGKGGGIVILGGGAIDPMQAAILAQLKKGST